MLRQLGRLGLLPYYLLHYSNKVCVCECVVSYPENPILTHKHTHTTRALRATAPSKCRMMWLSVC